MAASRQAGDCHLMDDLEIHIYCVEPIDSWLGWSDEEQFRSSLDRWCAPANRNVFWTLYEQFRDRSQELARDFEWEGDIREGPFIAGVPIFPVRNVSLFMIAWKQRNDGRTFIASPVALPWLESPADG